MADARFDAAEVAKSMEFVTNFAKATIKLRDAEKKGRGVTLTALVRQRL